MLEVNPKKRASLWELRMHAWMKQTPQKRSFLSRLLTKRTRSSDALVKRTSPDPTEQPAKKSKSFQELRISKSTFQAETSSLKPVEEIVSELERVFSLLTIDYQPSPDKGVKYNCRDVIRNVKFEVEICKIDKLEGFKGIKIKKKSGSNYDFSALQENLRSLLKL